jgi:hypothetical protein
LPVALTTGRSAAAIAAWLWVDAVTAAYLFQFIDYLRPILAFFG